MTSCSISLPQGAPTSPALANLCAFRLDKRLAELARRAGARYSRYADDLAFSGGDELRRGAHRFHAMAAGVAMDTGFAVNFRKSRIMNRSVRQRLAGVVVNQKTAMARSDWDRLKATLYNCVRHGPSTQNRDGHPHFRQHLEGRVSWAKVLNPARAAKLEVLLTAIDWSR